jgi:Predicted metalloendopeptidase
MSKIKRWGIIASICTLILTMSPTSNTYVRAAEVNVQATNTNETVQLQDDFYEAVNNKWMNTTKIEDGKSTNSTFDEIEETVNNQTKEIINQLLLDKDKYPANSDEKKIINLYNNILNIEARNQEGLKPVQKILDEIRAAKTTEDIAKLWGNKDVINSTMRFVVERDIKDAKTNILYMDSTGLSLGDSDEYTDPTDETVKNKKLTEEYYNKILVLSGYSKEEAKVKVDNMFKFEGMIAPYIMGKKKKAVTSNLIDSMYNVYTMDQLNDLAPNLNLPLVMSSLGIDKANKIVLEEPKWLEALSKIYTQENVPIIKNYIEIVNLIHAANYLSEDFEKANKEYESSLLGITGTISKESDAIDTINSSMGMAIGKIYAERYISPKTKEDVQNITKEIIQTYKKRINNLDWMSSSTKKNAIEKLDKLNVKIGYPENWLDYSKINIKSYEEGSSLFENMMILRKFANERVFSKINKPVNKAKESFTPQTVNAFYSANENSIIIPGGLIQGHFYNSNGSVEENLGGIGTIIGHEISHAFDNTGALYDADGNLNNWWSPDDYKQFKEKALKIAQFYSFIEALPGERIDGYRTVGENIADIGGMSCLIDILSTMKNPNYKTFFESYAVTWRQISTKQYDEYVLLLDDHSPNKFRVNAVLAQFQKFYDTYGITENNGMYISPEYRLGIW